MPCMTSIEGIFPLVFPEKTGAIVINPMLRLHRLAAKNSRDACQQLYKQVLSLAVAARF